MTRTALEELIDVGAQAVSRRPALASRGDLSARDPEPDVFLVTARCGQAADQPPM